MDENNAQGKEEKPKLRNELSGLIDQFLEYLEIEKNCSKLTIRDYRHYLEVFNEWFSSTLPDKSYEDLDLATVRRYRVYLSNRVDEQDIPPLPITPNSRLSKLIWA